MDHLVSPSALRDAGIRFVAEAELRRIPSVASRVDAPGGEVEVIVADDDADAVRAGMSDSIASLVAVLPAGADAATTTRVLGSGAAAAAATPPPRRRARHSCDCPPCGAGRSAGSTTRRGRGVQREGHEGRAGEGHAGVVRRVSPERLRGVDSG